MENSHLMHEVKIMAQAVADMKQVLKRLDLLGLEILEIKKAFRTQIQIFRNRICAILGAVSVNPLTDEVKEVFQLMGKGE